MAPKRKRTQKKKGSSEEREEKSAKQAKPNAEEEVGDESDPEEEAKQQDKGPPVPTGLVYNYINKGKKVRLPEPDWVDGHAYNTQIGNKFYHNTEQTSTRRHMTNKAGGGFGTSTEVPPIHSSWPMRKFKRNMPFDDFLQALVDNPECLAIMQWETDFEVNMKHEFRLKDPNKKTTSPHFVRNLQYRSWSAMLQLEYTYPAVMENCVGWDTCFMHMWEKFLDKSTSHARFMEIQDTVLENINTILHVQWANSGKAEPSSVKTLKTKIFDTLNNSKLWKKHGTEEQYKLLVKSGPLQLPDDIAASLRFSGEQVVARALKQPQRIHESVILKGVKKLMTEIFGDEMDTNKEVDLGGENLIGLSTKAKAVCVLLELACGSRMIGILLFNWFNKIATATMEEWEKEKLPQSFGSWERCIEVTRLSKEGTRAARQEKARAAGIDDNIQDRVIVKPINTMFFDRQFLAPDKDFKPTTEKRAVDVFLYLIDILRKYIFRKDRAGSKGLRWVTNDGGQVGVVDEQVDRLPKQARTWVNGMEISMGTYARTVFDGMFRPKQGTHLLRKIYMIWSYNAFAAKTMKETGYAAEVLGHRGFKVSLNYTSLLITRSISGEVKSNKQVEEKLNLMQRMLDDMKQKLVALTQAKQVDDVANDEVAFLVEGKVVILKKLERAPKGMTFEQHMERAMKIVELLRKHKIPMIWTNMKKLGVNNTEEVRKRVKEVLDDSTVARSG